jgi:hypothetical protein
VNQVEAGLSKTEQTASPREKRSQRAQAGPSISLQLLILTAAICDDTSQFVGNLSTLLVDRLL